jgi:MATE family multidrug resistance protein
MGPTADSSTRSPEAAAARALGGLREVSLLAYPVVLTQISITSMQLVDTAMVGSLGATALGAVGFGGVWVWTATCFFLGTTTAVQTFVAQKHGAGDHASCGRWAWQGLYGILPLTAAAALLLFLVAPTLVSWLAPSAEMQPLTVDYIRARAPGTVGITAAVALSSFFRGVGDTVTPLITTVLANVINAILDYGLIFGRLGLPELGVQGAGIATATAEWIYLIALVFFFRRHRLASEFGTRRAPFVPSEIRRLLRTGLPIGGQWWLEMTSFAAFSTLVVRMGDAPMAATQAFIALLGISFMQALGIGTAVSTLVGRYIGAADPASAERSFRSGMKLGLMVAVVIAVLFIGFPGPLISVFTQDPQVIALGIPLLMVGACFQIFDAMAIVADGALRGAGDTRWPFVIRFLLSWGLFLPLAYFLGFYLALGLTWAWIGGAIYISVLGLVLVLRFRSGAWKHLEI